MKTKYLNKTNTRIKLAQRKQEQHMN